MAQSAPKEASARDFLDLQDELRKALGEIARMQVEVGEKEDLENQLLQLKSSIQDAGDSSSRAASPAYVNKLLLDLNAAKKEVLKAKEENRLERNSLAEKVQELEDKLKSSNLPWGKLGLSICYDLRFPNMFRKLSKDGSDYISIPSAFTETTGKRHWHSLLKARAIENFCYIFAPAQGGTHYNGRKTFGHSMVVSPDGKILKELKKSEGVITVSIDPDLPKKLRSIIPSLKFE